LTVYRSITGHVVGRMAHEAHGVGGRHLLTGDVVEIGLSGARSAGVGLREQDLLTDMIGKWKSVLNTLCGFFTSVYAANINGPEHPVLPRRKAKAVAADPW
jgi:hypothetical protein